MPIDTLHISRWFGNTRQDTKIASPSWEQVEDAIRALNNLDLNDLYLLPDSDDPETYLCVGGGHGNYVVSGAIRNQTFPTLIDNSKPNDEFIDLTVGGQRAPCPLSSVVDLEKALRAVKAFYDAGGFECGIEWQIT